MNGECPRTTASYSFLLAARTPGLHCRAKALSSEEGLQIDYVTPLYGLTLRSLSLASKRTKNSRTAAQLESDSREYTESVEQPSSTNGVALQAHGLVHYLGL